MNEKEKLQDRLTELKMHNNLLENNLIDYSDQIDSLEEENDDLKNELSEIYEDNDVMCKIKLRHKKTLQDEDKETWLQQNWEFITISNLESIKNG